MNPIDFINIIAPIAIKLKSDGSHIFPSVRIAQSMLETGIKIHPWFNLVGFKATKNTTPYWNGDIVRLGTWEEEDGTEIKTQANWRVYKSIEDCYRDQDLLFEWSNYDNVRNAKTPELQCDAFIQSPMKYATDSKYSNKIIEYINDYNLKLYDEVKITMTVTDANKLIDLLSAIYKGFEQKESHRLANVLRVASGQKEQ